MVAPHLAGILESLRRTASSGCSDAELWERFVAHREEAAFAELVRRHGPMVLGVCRRILKNQADAEDAFQAAFLVLARKAASIGRPALLGHWLYGVARNAALKGKAMIDKRRRKEQAAADARQATPPDQGLEELQDALDEELGRLPEKYQRLLVFCELEGRSIKEVADQLRLPPGTVASRLSRGRALLAARLRRRGVAVSAATLAGLASSGVAPAGVPPALLNSTMKAALAIAAGEATAKGLVTAQALTISKGVLKALWLTKLIICGVVLLGALGICAAGVGVLSRHAAAQPGRTEAVVALAPAPAAEKKPEEKAEVRKVVGTLTFVRSPRFGRSRASFKIHNGPQVPLRFGAKDGGKNDAVYDRAWAIYRSKPHGQGIVLITGRLTPLADADKMKGIAAEDQTAALDVLDVRPASTPVEKDGLSIALCADHESFALKEPLKFTVMLQNVSKKDFSLYDLSPIESHWQLRVDEPPPSNWYYQVQSLAAGKKREISPTVLKPGASIEVPVELSQKNGFQYLPKPKDGKQDGKPVPREHLLGGNYEMRVGVTFSGADKAWPEEFLPLWTGDIAATPIAFEISDKGVGPDKALKLPADAQALGDKVWSKWLKNFKIYGTPNARGAVARSAFVVSADGKVTELKDADAVVGFFQSAGLRAKSDDDLKELTYLVMLLVRLQQVKFPAKGELLPGKRAANDPENALGRTVVCPGQRIGAKAR